MRRRQPDVSPRFGGCAVPVVAILAMVAAFRWTTLHGPQTLTVRVMVPKPEGGGWLPAQGAEVHVFGIGRSFMAEGRSDREGQFHVPRLRAGAYQVDAALSERAVRPALEIVEVAPGSRGQHTLWLDPVDPEVGLELKPDPSDGTDNGVLRVRVHRIERYVIPLSLRVEDDAGHTLLALDEQRLDGEHRRAIRDEFDGDGLRREILEYLVAEPRQGAWNGRVLRATACYRDPWHIEGDHKVRQAKVRWP